MSLLIGRGRYARETYPKGSPPPGVAASTNWSIIQGIPHSQTQGGLNVAIPVMSAALRMKFSGMPYVDCSAYYRSNTVAAGIALVLVVSTFAPPIASRFAAAGVGTLGSPIVVATSVETAVDGANPTDWAALLGSDAAGVNANTLSFDGTVLSLAGRSITEAVVTTPNPAASDFTFAFSGPTPNPNGLNPILEQVFPIDNFVVATLVLFTNAGGSVVSFSNNATISIYEMAP